MKTPLFALGALATLQLFAGSSFAATAPVASSQGAVLPNVTYKPSEVINLWPGTAPGEKGGLAAEHVLPDRPRPFDQITDVSVPTLSVFLPPAEKNTGTAMLVIPGGGLERLAIEHEGIEVAEWLNGKGIAAFVLKYRVPPRDPAQRWKVGLQDAQRAMGIIRSRAAEWRVDSDAVGTAGFSAGGEINLMLSTYHAEPRQYEPIDAADKLSTRPDFNLVIYGGGFANARDNTLRADIASRINASTPPMFIAHAFDDAALSSVILMGALKRANIASELHIFGAGGHGFGVRGTGLPVGHWSELSLNWLAWQGFLDVAAVRSYAVDFVKARASATAELPRLSAVLPKADLDQAFAAQRCIVRQAEKNGAEVVGYKGAFTTVSAQSTAKLAQPLHGVLFKSGKIEAKPGASVNVRSERPLLVETEIGYVIAVDIGTKLQVPRQALTTVEAIVPVIELPISSAPAKAGVPAASPLDAVAQNVGSNQFIVGAALAPSKIANPDAVSVTLRRGDQTLHTTTGADAKDGQAKMLMTLINQIIDQGHVLHRGDIIISGALGGAKPGEKGNYTADFGALGTIAFTIE